MAKYLLLKHYRGAPPPLNDVPMDQWAPEEVSAHMQYMRDFANRLQRAGEFVDSQALSLHLGKPLDGCEIVAREDAEAIADRAGRVPRIQGTGVGPAAKGASSNVERSMGHLDGLQPGHIASVKAAQMELQPLNR